MTSRAECRNGHLAVLGTVGPCLDCNKARDARYNATPAGRARRLRYNPGYQATVAGQLAGERRRLKYRMHKTITRVAELERTLQYGSS